MSMHQLTILTLEDDPGDVEVLRRHLEDIVDWRIRLVVADKSRPSM